MRYHKKLDLARTAIFLNNGINNADPGRYGDVLRILGGGGQVEGAFIVAEQALIVFKSMHRLYKALDCCFPGVYEYEVTEEVGEQIAAFVEREGVGPDEDDILEWLRILEGEFVERGGMQWPGNL